MRPSGHGPSLSRTQAGGDYVSNVLRYVVHGPVRAADERVVAMLTIAFDESGSHDDARFISLAGYIADVGAWEQFSLAWVQSLKDTPVEVYPPPVPGDPPTPFFHMTDWENRKKQFAPERFPERKRIPLFQRCANLIDQHAEFGFAMSVDRAAYARLIAPRFPESSGYRDPYMWCVEALMETLYYAKTPEGIDGVRIVDPEPVACMFEAGHKLEGRIGEYYSHFREKWNAGHVFGSFATETKRRFVPLQSADILAYEARKHIEHERPKRRETLTRLLRERRLKHMFAKEEELAATAARIDRDGPGGSPEDVLSWVVGAPRADRPSLRRRSARGEGES